MKRIFRVVLRTLDVGTAQDFYRSVLGETQPRIERLHEQAVARGARPHWLGMIDVEDVDRASAAFLERGAVRLGPKWVDPDGFEAAVMRDPGGAIIALAGPPAAAAQEAESRIATHTLSTHDVARAMATCGELFGWHFDVPLELGRDGTFHPFAWQAGQPQAGVFGDVAGRPGVHPHWLFHFRVADLDAALVRVEASGGVALAPIALPGGARIAACDDPQGAAFGLYQGPAARDDALSGAPEGIER